MKWNSSIAVGFSTSKRIRMSHHSDDNMLIASSDSFWEPGNYKRTTKRIEDGYKLCSEFLAMVQERADIEKNYAKSLKAWSKKWNELIEKGCWRLDRSENNIFNKVKCPRLIYIRIDLYRSGVRHFWGSTERRLRWVRKTGRSSFENQRQLVHWCYDSDENVAKGHLPQGKV